MNKYFQYFLAILVIILGASVTLNTVDEYISRNSDVALRNIDASGVSSFILNIRRLETFCRIYALGSNMFKLRYNINKAYDGI